jgi:DinB superfamily
MTATQLCLLQWNAYNKRIQKVIDSLQDDNFSKPITPGGNSPSWLMGHLADTDDKLFELFAIRPRMYPELEKIYHHDRNTNQLGHLSKDELNVKWKAITAELDNTFQKMTDADWLGRHQAVSEEDFAKEPHRNKLSVLLSRVGHKASHLGQVAMQGK